MQANGSVVLLLVWATPIGILVHELDNGTG